MERKFYTDNFEQLLKEKSDEFRMYPSKRVWHSIYNDLHPGRKWPSVAVSLILIIALLMTGYWNNKSTLVTQRLASSKNIYASITGTPVNNSAVPSGTIAGAGNNTSVVAEKLNAANSINTVTAQQNTITHVSSAVTAPATYVNRGNPLAPVHARRTIIASSANTVAPTTTNINNTPPSAISGNGINSELTAATVNNNGAIAGSNPVSSINQNGVKAKADATIVPVTITATEEAVVTLPKLDSKENHQEEIISVPGNAVIKIASSEAATTNATALVNTNIVKDESKAGTDNTPSASQSTSSGAYKKTISADDKAWIEDYAFHNKSKRKKWQDRTAFSFYLTPGAVFGKLSNDAKYNLPAASPSITNGGGTVGNANNAVNKRPGLGIEGGFSINYSLAKKLLVNAGIQANITSYGINAYETNHPVLTTLMLIDPNSGFPYMHSSLSTLSNIGGSQPVVLHNQTFQVSLPLGFAFKLWGNDKLAWYTGATIQPTFVAGGKAYLISADRNNYVADPSLIRKWNLNTGIESYITYKFDGFSLQAGPQYRRQLMSTYYNKYTVNEKLSNVGIKLGLIKNF